MITPRLPGRAFRGPVRPVLSLGRFFAGLAAFAGTAAGQPAPDCSGGSGTLDLSIDNLIVVQTIPNVTFGGGKATIVRTRVNVAGTLPAGTLIDGRLRIFDAGVEIAGSPIHSENGPYVPPLSVSLNNIDDTLNFVFIPPASNDLEFVVEINPPSFARVCEIDYTNNTDTTGSLVFECREKGEVVYVPIDYRPQGGETPNLPDLTLIEPGVGDNFLQAIYPGGDWDYHRSDVPRKIWFQSLSGTGSQLLNALLVDLNMMNPQPDFIYGWVPGGLSYNGQASGIPGRAGMGNTENIRHQRTFAHELGHCFGLVHISNTVGRVGVDVEHHLNITEGLPRIKRGTLSDVMVAGLLTNQAWVYDGTYEFVSNHSIFQCSTGLSAASTDGDTLLIGGLWDRRAGTVTLTDTVAFSGGIPTPTIPLAQADLVLRAYAGGALLGEFGLAVNSSTDCAATSDSPQGEVVVPGFVAVLPSSVVPGALERVEVADAATGAVLAEVVRSASAPSVQLLAPTAGGLLGAELLVAWDAADADGDALRHYVRYSPDGQRLVPLAANLTDTRFAVDMTSLPEPRPGRGFFEVLTTDGLSTTSVRAGGLTAASQLRGSRTNPPWTHVLTPDDGKVFPKGASVVLHGSGWDLEDRSLEGADLEWSSDLDGLVATGRLTTVTSLSVGTHVLTLTATDSNGNMTIDATSITITDREVPPALCQPNLGFGGPGSSVLQVCGGDLSTGTSAEARLTGAAPNVPLGLIYSDMLNPVPALGGTLAPVPILGFEPGVTDAAGSWTLPGGLAGGGGPITYYAQVVYLNPGFGFGISNAVQVDFLP